MMDFRVDEGESQGQGRRGSGPTLVVPAGARLALGPSFCMGLS